MPSTARRLIHLFHMNVLFSGFKTIFPGRNCWNASRKQMTEAIIWYVWILLFRKRWKTSCLNWKIPQNPMNMEGKSWHSHFFFSLWFIWTVSFWKSSTFLIKILHLWLADCQYPSVYQPQSERRSVCRNAFCQILCKQVPSDAEVQTRNRLYPS